MSILIKSVLFLSLICTLTSCCYRMPEDDEFSMIPSTNNPHYTREKENQTPGVGY